MVALGFQKNEEGIEDIMEQMKVSLRLAEERNKELSTYLDNERKTMEEKNQSSLRQQTMELRKEELTLKKQKLDTELAVASINKNKYDGI